MNVTDSLRTFLDNNFEKKQRKKLVIEAQCWKLHVTVTSVNGGHCEELPQKVKSVFQQLHLESLCYVSEVETLHFQDRFTEHTGSTIDALVTAWATDSDWTIEKSCEVSLVISASTVSAPGLHNSPQFLAVCPEEHKRITLWMWSLFVVMGHLISAGTLKHLQQTVGCAHYRQVVLRGAFQFGGMRQRLVFVFTVHLATSAFWQSRILAP